MYYMKYLHEHLDLLMYLRFHPRWYKILYYDPDSFASFVDEAKRELKIRNVDKLENIKKQIEFFSGFRKFMK